MAANVRMDLIRDSKMRVDLNTLSLVRTFFVEGINTISGITDDNYLPSALLAVNATGCVYGSQHPTQTGLLASEFDNLPVSDTQCLILVTFRAYSFQGPGFSVEYDSAVSQEQTNYDVNNPDNPLVVYYWPDPNQIGQKSAKIKFDGAAGAMLKPQGCTVSVYKPFTTKTVSFYHQMAIVARGSQADQFIKNLLAAVGFCNKIPWDGGDKGTWLCTNVKTTRVGTPIQVLVTCQFVYRPQTWLAWASWRDITGSWPPSTHKNLKDPQQLLPRIGSNGWAGFFVYKLLDFNGVFDFENFGSNPGFITVLPS